MKSYILKILILATTPFLSNELLAGTPSADYQRQRSAVSAFRYLHQVATHPRCSNCHGSIDSEGLHRPLVGDDRRTHSMNISILNNPSSKVSLGTDCQTCHGEYNSFIAESPGGAANDLMPGFLWHMPPSTMIVPANISQTQLCQNWLNPRLNGNRGSRQDFPLLRKSFVDEHVLIDPLVIWAWDPGGTRQPAPGSHKLFVEAMETWIDAGAPCP